MSAESDESRITRLLHYFIRQSVRETSSPKGIRLLLLVEERVARNRRIGRPRADSPDIDVFEQY